VIIPALLQATARKLPYRHCCLSALLILVTNCKPLPPSWH